MDSTAFTQAGQEHEEGDDGKTAEDLGGEEDGLPAGHVGVGGVEGLHHVAGGGNEGGSGGLHLVLHGTVVEITVVGGAVGQVAHAGDLLVPHLIARVAPLGEGAVGLDAEVVGPGGQGGVPIAGVVAGQVAHGLEGCRW